MVITRVASRVITRVRVAMLMRTLALLLLGQRAASGPMPTNKRPNIVYAIADDIGFGDFRPWHNNSRINAKHIEELAMQGTTFTRAYAPASVCAPSRYACLTGGNCHRAREPWGSWRYPSPSNIRRGQRTLASMLKAAGYSTAFVGKWHVGGGMGPRARETQEHSPGGPRAHGFNTSLTLPRGIQNTPYMAMLDDRDRSAVEADGKARLVEPLQPCGAEFGSTRLVRWAWIRQMGPCLAHHAASLLAKLREPFFLYYASQAAHAPFVPPVDFGGGLGPVAGQTKLGPQGDMFLEFDLAVGALVEALKARRVLGRTIVVVTSDNGGACMMPPAQRVRDNVCPPIYGMHQQMAGLSGFKGTPWEGGVRVPLLVRWGGADGEQHRTPPDTLSSELVSLVDLVKALALAADAKLGPLDAPDALDLRAVLLYGAGARPRTARAQRRALADLALSSEARGAGLQGAPTHLEGRVAQVAPAAIRRTAMLLQSGGLHGYFFMLYVGRYKAVFRVAGEAKDSCTASYMHEARTVRNCLRMVSLQSLVDLTADPLERRDLKRLPGHPTTKQLTALFIRLLRSPETHTSAALPAAELLSLANHTPQSDIAYRKRVPNLKGGALLMKPPRTLQR